MAELTQRALDLSPEERRTFVETLWDSLDQGAAALPLHPWQEQLLEERLEAAQRNPNIWVDWEEVQEEVRAALAARRRV